MPFCPECGKEVVSGAKFCSRCGAPLGKTPSTPSTRVDRQGGGHWTHGGPVFVIAGYPVGVAVVVLGAIYVLLGLMGAVASIGASELVGLFLILLGALVFGGSYGLRRRLSWAHREARVSGVLCILFGLLLLVSGLYLQGIGSVAFGVAEFYVAKKHSPEGAGLTPAPTYENEMGGADQGRS